ncbi:MAG TPA: hypothetical protein GX707_01060, partial [Epulopiscium sp.]|nr:hypothetical protein [Candidatus Epulonipiscium sp.]
MAEIVQQYTNQWYNRSTIFEDIYEWAGEERVINIVKGERVLGGDTVRYSDINFIEEDVN